MFAFDICIYLWKEGLVIIRKFVFVFSSTRDLL